MNKRKIGILVLALCFFSVLKAPNAACDYETQVRLRREAANVNAVYEPKRVIMNLDTGLEDPKATDEDVNFDGPYYYDNKVTITIMNITESIYIEVTGDNGFSQTYHYEDSNDGTIELDGGNAEQIVNYEIKVYSDNSNCSGEDLHTIKLVTPKYNPYSKLLACESVSEYYCNPFVTYDINYTESEVIEMASKKKNENQNPDNPTKTEENNFWENYKWYIIAGGIIVIGVATTAILIKKRRSRVL